MALRRVYAVQMGGRPQNTRMKQSNSKLAAGTPGTRQEATVDAFDRRILATYQLDTRVSAQVIGDAVGLSAAAVQRRIKRMRGENVITAEIAAVNPDAVGLPVTVVVHVDIERETSRHIDAFKAAMAMRPEVQQCWYTTGLTDFILVVRVASMAAYEKFTREALVSQDNVAKFTSYVVLAEVKAGLALNI